VLLAIQRNRAVPVTRVSTAARSKRQHPLAHVLFPKDGFAKAKALNVNRNWSTILQKNRLSGGMDRPLVKDLAAVGALPQPAPVQVPATKNEASLFLMLSAAWAMARSSALCQARCWANRWAEPGISNEAVVWVEVLKTTLFVAISVRVKEALITSTWLSGLPLATSTITVAIEELSVTCNR
jgi:hypothetical protein